MVDAAPKPISNRLRVVPAGVARLGAFQRTARSFSSAAEAVEAANETALDAHSAMITAFSSWGPVAKGWGDVEANADKNHDVVSLDSRVGIRFQILTSSLGLRSRGSV